jgi:transcriptional regulator GlxA family with amidase domain
VSRHFWFVLTPNVLLLDYTGPAEALRLARDMGADFVLHACAPQRRVVTSMGLALSGLEALPRRLPEHSTVLVVGTSDEARDFATPQAKQLVRWLQTVPTPTIQLASICSGALLLARAGLLAGVRCTTHHSVVDMLQAWEPQADVVTDRIFVDDGRVLTSAGMTTGIDMALHLVEQYAGPELAARVARRMVVYQRRGTHDRQSSPWLAHRNHLHPAVHRAQDAIAQNPKRAWTVSELAQVACVSPRQLSRIFAQHAGIGAVAYQQQLRVACAQRLLAAQPLLPMERVAEQCGFGSARDLRRVWRRHAAAVGS